MALKNHRRIKLTPYFQRDYVVNVIDVFRITLTASEAHLMPDAIFAYRTEPLQPGAAATVAVFDHVCSPVDLQEYPVGAPHPAADPPWFRLTTVDVEERTRALALEVYEEIVEDVTALVLGMNAADVLVAQPPLWIGYTDVLAHYEHSALASEGSLN